jgi:hypothetical protein
MNTIARIFLMTVSAAFVAAQPVAADSVVRVHASDTTGFERFLPALPSDVPWLAADRRAPPTSAVLVPEAPNLSAWMLSPRPAEAWSTRSVQSAGAAPSWSGM